MILTVALAGGWKYQANRQCDIAPLEIFHRGKTKLTCH